MPPADDRSTVDALLQRGVVIHCPASVHVLEDVDPDRIAPGVVIHAGCRILGGRTSIGPGSELGAEAPVTLESSQLGRGVAIKGGFVSCATFLDGSSIGSGAHVRPGTLLEEEANGAHAVGLKQTLLFPFVTTGSLINFCDALVAGGTSRKDHSEIGSSYIHFNFTPHQDKATASLVGDVPRGVMLDRPAIFLGGQGGLVGPVRIAFGTVIPAGIICRQDVLEENRLYAPPAAASAPRAFRAGAYRSIQRIVRNNLAYIGNVQALKRWYALVRTRTMGDAWARACHEGALARIDVVLDERVKRLGELAKKMVRSLESAKGGGELALPPALVAQQQALIDRWPEMESRLHAGPAADTGARDRDAFLSAWERVAGGASHVEAVASLPADARKAGTAWLQAVVDSVSALWTDA